ncbi:MAG: DNA polymerase III subunit beta [Bacteriovoracaceae bacterium]
MKCQVTNDILKNALNKILSVVDKKNTRPILSYTLVKANEDNTIEFSATDLEVSARIKIEAIVENPGIFCVNAKNLYDIVRELPEDNIYLDKENDQSTLNLTCKEIHYSLLICGHEDFPHLNFCNESSEFILNSNAVVEMINKTAFAVSNDETRLYLNGIYLQEKDNKLRAVATDGHRLSLIDNITDQTLEHIEPLVNGIIIPKKGVFELKKLADTFPGEDLKISVDDSFMYINTNMYSLSIRLIAREYPKYQAVIPNKTSFSMSADKTSFFDAVRRIKIMSNEKSNGVRIKLNKNQMSISANHPSLGEALEFVPINYTGNDMEIGFNAKYLIDTLSNLDDGDINIELNNELSPVIIRSEKVPNYLGIIMPLKL